MDGVKRARDGRRGIGSGGFEFDQQVGGMRVNGHIVGAVLEDDGGLTLAAFAHRAREVGVSAVEGAA